jgi:hypothetical protein
MIRHLFVSTPPSNRDNSDEIDERLSILPIIHNTSLTLFIRHQTPLQMRHGVMAGIPPLITFVDGDTRGSLEETAVTAEDLVFGVACEGGEGGRGVDDGGVVAADVGDEEGAG